jgi:dihydroorotase
MSAKPLLLKNGHLIDPAQGIDGVCDLLIENGRVAKTGKNLKADSAEVVDLKNKIVCPGFIDLHVHFRTPGQEHKETIKTGSRAALRGGFTTVCLMANTDPVVDSPTIVEYIKGEAAKAGLIQVLPYGAVTIGLKGENLTEMAALQAAGVVGFSDDGMPVSNAGMMRRALEYSRVTGLPVIDHCEEKSLSGHGVMHEGLTSCRLGLAGVPAEAETVMIARDLLLAEATGGKLHIAHVSTAAGVDLVRAAKKRGVAVTAEVTPHHLTLSDEALESYDPRFKMNPPLRLKKDVEALREALKDGTIDAIATDHAPHSSSEKETGLIQAPFGVIGLETALAVLLTQLVQKQKFPLAALIAAWTQKPAKIIGSDRGTLVAGAPADVTVFDPEQEWVPDADQTVSKSKNSPFIGWKLKGRVTDVWVSGQPRYRDGRFLTEE